MKVKNIILGILVLALGILITIKPQESIYVAVVLLGVVLIVSGILNLIKVLKLSDSHLFKKTVLIRNIVSIVIGIFAVALPIAFSKVIETIIMVMLYIMAVYLIVGAIAQMIIVGQLKHEGKDVKSFTGEIIASIIVAILLFLLGADFAVNFVRVIGIIFIVCGIAYLIYSFINRPIIIQPDEVRDVDNSAE